MNNPGNEAITISEPGMDEGNYTVSIDTREAVCVIYRIRDITITHFETHLDLTAAQIDACRTDLLP